MERLEHALKFASKLKHARDNRPHKGHVYILQCHEFVKVGFADKVAIRLAALQVGCPYELRLIASWPSECVERDEARLHCLWKRYELRGEWFNVPAGELACVVNADRFDGIFPV
jgi:hypothetical protein